VIIFAVYLACQLGGENGSEPSLDKSPQCQIGLLDGTRIDGSLQTIQASTLVMAGNGEKTTRQTIMLDQVLRIDFAPTSPTPTPIRVRMVDGTGFGCDDVHTGKEEAFFKRGTENLTVSLSGVAAILTSKIPHEQADWQANALVTRRNDRIVIARENRRLVLDGTLHSIGPEKLLFSLDGDELPINRNRLRACYFSHQKSEFVPVAVVTERNGDTWHAREFAWKKGAELRTPTGIIRHVPIKDLASINFAAARITYLSDLEPSLMSHTPAFDHPWPMLKDRNALGSPIELDNKRFSKGLVLHSRTLVEYALAGKYSRFLADIGIEAHAGRLGDCPVRILADGQELWSRRLRAGAKAISVSLNISRVQKLRLEVDFGAGLDAGDHAAFGDARVVK
jgi:hypothetical protein